jgi:hypothetical protein
VKFPLLSAASASAILLFLTGTFGALRAATVSLIPVADTTLWQTDPNNNLGGHTDFVTGTTRNLQRSRGLLRFNLASAIPAGAIINSVTLTLTVVKVSNSGGANSTFELHRVLQNWGEGDNTSRRGTAANANEANWNNRFAPSTPWSMAGAAAPLDFASAVSGTRAVAGLGAYTFSSTAGMVADVQNWVNNPANNFGWLLASQSESTAKTARRFASREAGAGRPNLFIDFTPVPEPGANALLTLGGLSLYASRLHRRRHHR